MDFWLVLYPLGSRSVMGVITSDSTGPYCAGDVVSVTCTITGALLTWDIPDTTRDIVIDSRTTYPFQRDRYTVTFASTNISSVTSTVSFPVTDGTSIGCLPTGVVAMREELVIHLSGRWSRGVH